MCSSVLILSLSVVFLSLATICDSSGPRSILVVDPFIDFLHEAVVIECIRRNVTIIEAVCGYTDAILTKSGDLSFRHVVPGGLDYPMLKRWCNAMDPTDSIVAAISESDVGTVAAERLQVALGLSGNGFSPHLRSKYATNEACCEAGLKTTKQVLTNDWKVANEFIETLSGGSCVVKPQRGVASDGVFLCQNKEQAKSAFEKLLGANTYGGGKNEEVLVQEFAEGPEYAIDTVSRDGVVKVLAIWKYTKVAANGAPFVYQCTELVPYSDDVAAAVSEYCVKCLDAVKLRWGPAHTEVKLTLDGPRLIEINARWHSANFYKLCRQCLGFDALTATLDCYIDPEEFSRIPVRPPPLLKQGRIVHLIGFVDGKVSKIRHLSRIRSMESHLASELFVNVGDETCKTVDIRSDVGYVLLCHNDPATVLANYIELTETLQKQLLNVD